MAQMVKNLPIVQESSVLSSTRSGRSPGEENGNPLPHSCLESSWREETE